jgi:hypothetical protein
MNLTSTTYDLTVSHANLNNNNVLQRHQATVPTDLSDSSMILNQPLGTTKAGGNGTASNRTFADSVINHQQ